MSSLTDLLQHGAAHAWLFMPTAIMLGALHGLEPGHSKTMMAAFIIAVRGTVGQAVLLGLSAALSHTAIVWIIALGGQYLGRDFESGAIEPYLQLASAAIVACVAVWMIWRTRRGQLPDAGQHDHGHDHDHGHGHGHDDNDHDHHHHGELEGLKTVQGGQHMDAHERAHANAIARRFRGASVTTGQIVMFGLTGGLIPCPAAITVLLLCLQLKQLTLGVVLVVCFSIGLAVTMVSAGVIAALSVRQMRGRWSGFSALARRAPYASGALMLAIAAYMAFMGSNHLPG